MPRSVPPRISLNRVLARLQTLCCLGLGGALAIPAVLAELHDLVGSDSNEFYWAGADLDIANAYMESPDFGAIAPLYFQTFHNRHDNETQLSFAELMRAEYDSPVDDFYHRVLRVPLAE